MRGVTLGARVGADKGCQILQVVEVGLIVTSRLAGAIGILVTERKTQGAASRGCQGRGDGQGEGGEARNTHFENGGVELVVRARDDRDKRYKNELESRKSVGEKEWSTQWVEMNGLFYKRENVSKVEENLGRGEVNIGTIAQGPVWAESLIKGLANHQTLQPAILGPAWVKHSSGSLDPLLVAFAFSRTYLEEAFTLFSIYYIFVIYRSLSFFYCVVLNTANPIVTNAKNWLSPSLVMMSLHHCPLSKSQPTLDNGVTVESYRGDRSDGNKSSWVAGDSDSIGQWCSWWYADKGATGRSSRGLRLLGHPSRGWPRHCSRWKAFASSSRRRLRMSPTWTCLPDLGLLDGLMG